MVFVLSESPPLPPAPLTPGCGAAVSAQPELGSKRGRFPQLRIKLGDPACIVELVAHQYSQTPVKASSLKQRAFIAFDKLVKHFWLLLDFSSKGMKRNIKLAHVLPQSLTKLGQKKRGKCS